MDKKEKEEKDLQEKKKNKIPIKMTKDNFLILLLLGVLLLVIVWPTGKQEAKEEEITGLSGLQQGTGLSSAAAEKAEVSLEIQSESSMLSYAAYLEKTLEDLLSTMEGAGKVKVMITMESSEEAVLEKDVITVREGSTEVDSAGGSRNTTNISDQEETVYTEGQSSQQVPYVKKINSPKVEGVLVAAEGGNNTKVAKNITEAIQALFGIEAHKIKIVKMNSQ